MLIQKESLVAIAMQRIKEHIVANDYKPGDKYLAEKELTELLQVSRTVVREALISLQSIGLLTIKRNGNYISDENLQAIRQILQHHYDLHGVKLRELIEIRKVIELGALRLIIENNTWHHAKELHELNEKYYQHIMDGTDTRQADRQFHQALVKATGNKLYANFSEIIQDYFAMTNINLNQNKPALLQSYKEHHLIIDLIKKRKLDQAQEMMLTHFHAVIDYINELEGVTNDETD